MKPDGKIQGVDVWVREWMGFGVVGQWCIADGDERHTEMWVNCDGLLSGDSEKETHLFPSREDALAHLRELEEKERPVIDLSTAKFGDKFKRGDGKIETYACPQEGEPDWHVMQSGETYSTNGSYVDRPNDERNIVAPYTPPRTSKVWMTWWTGDDGSPKSRISFNESSFKQLEKDIREAHGTGVGHAFCVLTEGEGL